MQVRYQTAPRSDIVYFLLFDHGASPAVPSRNHTRFWRGLGIDSGLVHNDRLR
jgi:hypothetical protein